MISGFFGVRVLTLGIENMPKLNDLEAEIDIYACKYRHPDFAPFKGNRLYDLYPNNNVSQPGIVSQRPVPFPGLNEAGVEIKGVLANLNRCDQLTYAEEQFIPILATAALYT